MPVGLTKSILSATVEPSANASPEDDLTCDLFGQMVAEFNLGAPQAAQAEPLPSAPSLLKLKVPVHPELPPEGAAAEAEQLLAVAATLLPELEQSPGQIPASPRQQELPISTPQQREVPTSLPRNVLEAPEWSEDQEASTSETAPVKKTSESAALESGSIGPNTIVAPPATPPVAAPQQAAPEFKHRSVAEVPKEVAQSPGEQPTSPPALAVLMPDPKLREAAHNVRPGQHRHAIKIAALTGTSQTPPEAAPLGGAAFTLPGAPQAVGLEQPTSSPELVSSGTPVEPEAKVDASELGIEHQLDMELEGEWLDRLARDIVRSAAPDGQQLRFRLNPEHLGSLRVEITPDGNGTAVRITAETEAARSIIADAQPRLIAEARAQGVRISEAHVDLSGQGSGDPKHDGKAFYELPLRTARLLQEHSESDEKPTRQRSERYA